MTWRDLTDAELAAELAGRIIDRRGKPRTAAINSIVTRRRHPATAELIDKVLSA